MDDRGHGRPRSIGDALGAHEARVEDVLRRGDPAEIKRLYTELGELLETAVAEGAEEVPVLSLPETGRVVLDLLDGVGGRVLDAGCGPNPAISIALADDPSRRAVGVDIGLATVRLAKLVAERSGASFLGVVADVEALPFRRDAFDAAVCDDTIEHLPDDRAGAEELARVVRPGGRMVMATPNRHSLEVLFRKAADRLRGRRRPASDYYVVASHLREYTWAELERVLRPSFRIHRRPAVGWDGGWKRRLATRLVSVPLLRRLARMVVVEGEPRSS